MIAAIGTTRHVHNTGNQGEGIDLGSKMPRKIFVGPLGFIINAARIGEPARPHIGGGEFPAIACKIRSARPTPSTPYCSVTRNIASSILAGQALAPADLATAN